MSQTNTPAAIGGRHLPNLWDIAGLLCVFGALVAVSNAVRGTLVPIEAVTGAAVALDPTRLPEYAVRTTLRMFAALLASLLFTFTYAPLAAKSRRAGLIMIPILDILQSVPILGFLTFTTAFFMGLFPGRVMGLELASIFAIFTSQAWNMAFSFYQSLITVPGELDEATRGFRLTAWQRFWRLEVPFAIPGLVWNTMLSMSGGRASARTWRWRCSIATSSRCSRRSRPCWWLSWPTTSCCSVRWWRGRRGSASR